MRQYSHYFWHHTLHICIFVVTPNVSMISHTLYVGHHMYYTYITICTTYGITPTFYDITVLYLCDYTHSMYDITPAVCVASYTLYEASHPHFMTSHYIIYDSTFTVFLTSLPQHCIHCICVITTTLVMISDQHFAWYHTHFMYGTLWTLHILSSTLYELTQL